MKDKTIAPQNKDENKDTQKASKVKTKKHSRFFIGFLLIVLVAFAVTPYYYGEDIESVLNSVKPKPPVVSSSQVVVENNTGAINTLNLRLTELEGKSLSPQIIESIVNRIDVLEKELVSFGQKQNVFNSEIVASLNRKITELEKQLDDSALKNNANIGALIVSLMKLKEKALSGEPFAEEITAVKALAGQSKEIIASLADIKKYEKGIATNAEIRQSFPSVIKSALKPEALENASWTDKTWQKIKGLVLIRRVESTNSGEDALESADIIIAKAENLVKKDSLDEAKNLLAKLPENTLKSFTAWQEQVEALDMVTNKVNLMIETVLTSLMQDNIKQTRQSK